MMVEGDGDGDDGDGGDDDDDERFPSLDLHKFNICRGATDEPS